MREVAVSDPYIARMNKRIRIQHQAGFTLYELMITLLVVGVILSFGMANLSDFNRNGRMTASANDLHAAFHLARSESSRAKTNITVCASADGAQCGGDWNQGYIVFQDNDGDITVNGADAILRRHGAAETGVTLSLPNGATYFSYSATGLGRGNVAGNAVSQVIMCDDRGNKTVTSGPGGDNSAARLFVITPLGRATILRDPAQITAAGGCP
jgi:type IV fimbrial biogenesis protein FimT